MLWSPPAVQRRSGVIQVRAARAQCGAIRLRAKWQKNNCPEAYGTVRAEFTANNKPGLTMNTRNAGFAVLVVLSLAVCGYAGFAYGFRPIGAGIHPAMRAVFEQNRLPVYLHIFASLTALAIGPFQFLSSLRNKMPRLHRSLGRIYLGFGILLGGLAGLFMAMHAFGGWPARLGFASLALAWLYTGARAYRAIRERNFVLHRQWMVRNFALTFAAVTLRLMLPIGLVSGIRFTPMYIFTAWFCWIPNLVFAELLLRRERRPRAPTGIAQQREPAAAQR
jgi:uncharacterized membrane protein